MTSDIPIDVPPKSEPRVLAALALGIGLTLLTISIGVGAWSDGRAPFPFVWRDVALVYFVSASPLAWLLSGWIHRRIPATLSVFLAIVLLGVSVVPSLEEGLPTVAAAVLRVAMAFGVALSAALVARLLIGSPGEIAMPCGPRACRSVIGIGLLALCVLPSIYVRARCRHDLDRLAEYLDQGRIGEARRMAVTLLALDVHAELRGQPLIKVVVLFDREFYKLEALVANDLPEDAASHARLQRAQHLAMLGHTDAALAVLDKLGDAKLAADADNLRGTIYEARGEWTLALAAYQHAKDACESLPPSAMLLRATTGIAYSRRKSGDYVGAAKSYQELLALTPNADTHFLLALFYEDAQDADKARQHARRAMLLDPARYQKDGEKLIRKLAVFQFGCLRAFGG